MSKDEADPGKRAVDEFVRARVVPEYLPVVAMIRELMAEYAPRVTEAFSYGMPVYKARGIVAYFIPNKKGITFSFVRGVQFEDKYGLLRGMGKSARHVKIKRVAGVSQEALRYYIRQALGLDAK